MSVGNVFSVFTARCYAERGIMLYSKSSVCPSVCQTRFPYNNTALVTFLH